MSGERSFRGLLVWRQAMALTRGCYQLTKRLPPDERFGLTSQARRAAVSIAANIAEGTGRATKKDFVKFLRIAQGSLRELETYLILATDLELANPSEVDPLLSQAESVARLLNRLIQSLTPNT